MQKGAKGSNAKSLIEKSFLFAAIGLITLGISGCGFVRWSGTPEAEEACGFASLAWAATQRTDAAFQSKFPRESVVELAKFVEWSANAAGNSHSGYKKLAFLGQNLAFQADKRDEDVEYALLEIRDECYRHDLKFPDPDSYS